MRSIKDRGKPDVGELSKKYEGMSEAQLMDALLSNVRVAKQNGTFSAQELDEFVLTVSPSLDEQARIKLKKLVELIKSR